MKRLGWVFLATALFVALPLAAETLSQCMLNCLPGVNDCSNCCFAQYDAAKGPCFDGCVASQKPCFDAVWKSCEGKPSPYYCFITSKAHCDTAVFMCQRNCDGVVQIAGGCPGEVPPQKCPYNCQLWNPASQSCIGPAMNVCGNLQAAAADVADDEAEIHAARAKAAADAAAAHTEKLNAENAKKTKKKK